LYQARDTAAGCVHTAALSEQSSRDGTHLQADDALPRLHLLLIEAPLMFLGVLDADVHPGLAALGLGLRRRRRRRTEGRKGLWISQAGIWG